MKDWTVGPDGRSNSSYDFERAVTVVSEVLRSHRLNDSVDTTARLIVAKLAHQHGFGPLGDAAPTGTSEEP